MFQCNIKQVKTEGKIFRQSWTKHLETFSLLAQFDITTVETELDYYHQKVNVRVAERLKA